MYAKPTAFAIEIINVNVVYKINILVDCFNVSDVLNEINYLDNKLELNPYSVHWLIKTNERKY